MDSISSITEAVMKKADPGKKRFSARAAMAWRHIAGEDVARHTVATGVREGELLVSVDSAAWASQLALMKDHYLERLCSEIGHGRVTSIRFAVSKVVAETRRDEEQGVRVEEFYESGKTPSVPLSDTELMQAEYIAAAIPDETLRETALRVMIKDLEWKKGVRTPNEPETRSDGATRDNSGA